MPLTTTAAPPLHQAPDAKKEEFRKYLDKSGVVDALTKGACPPLPRSRVSARAPAPGSHRALRPAVLVGLYEEPERPPNAVEYVRKFLGAGVGVDVDALRAENERLRAENAELAEALRRKA